MLFGLCGGDLERLRSVHEWGYDFAEIGARTVIPFEPDSAWHARRRELEDTGAKITHLAGFITAEARFVGPDADWARTEAYLETVIGRASEIGVRVYNWGSPQSKSVPEGWPLSRAFEQIERACHLVADIMSKHDGTAAIEPINPGECNIIYYLTDALLLARSIGRPQIRINADLHHMEQQNEPWQHLERAKEYIAHTHTSGPGRHFPKEGDGYDHRRFFRELRKIGYDRTMAFECSRIPEGADYATEARAGVAYVRSLYAEVAREG
jgi:sugar phosphate isomerase/epimerase